MNFTTEEFDQAVLYNKLWMHCRKFIDEQNIHCEETIYQTDRVIENAAEFIQGVADIVGYKQDEEDDE